MSAHAVSTGRQSSTSTKRPVGAPTSTLLLTGLACCVGSSAHRGQTTHEHVMLLVLAYWGWRLGEDVFSKRKRIKGAQAQASKLSALSVGAQATALPLCLHHAGPLRTMLLLIIFDDMPQRLSLAELWPLVPSAAAAVVVLVQQSYNGLFSVLPLLGLCATTIFGRHLQTPWTKAQSAASSRRSLIVWSAESSILALVVLWLANAIAVPRLDDFTSSSSLFSLLFTCLLARYLPLDRISSSGAVKAAFDQPMEGAKVIGTIVATQLFALPPIPSRLELFVVLPLYAASIYLASRTSMAQTAGPSWSYIPSQISTTARYSIMRVLPASWRPHFQTILRTPTSSKIFYFLLLNLAYMAVQMAYGVITNSLGLISDSIHMLFDCLGLGVGLWASVAATWKPDGRYTYGYSRVETLSGFANGCFLILISIFIIFEAIQRIIDPPEVSTHQLLLVSSIGLAINLWGMYATGGHHHHGHSHGHSHEHNHVPVNDKKVDHRHDNGHAHPRTLTKKSSAHDLRPSLAPGHAHRRVSATTAHVHEHSHVDGEHCDHDHDHAHDHDDHDHSTHAHHHESHGGHDHHHDHVSHDHNHQDHHGHDHGHSHDDHGHHHHAPSSHGHAHSHNMRGVFLHVLADTLGSVGVIVSTILIRLTGWTVFDPLASLFIATLIMASVIPLVIDSAKVLCLDVGAETEVQVRAALSELASVEGLSNYSSPRFWPTCEGEVNGSIHIQLASIPGDTSKGPSFTPRLARPGDAIYYNADKVVARMEKVLRGGIPGLTEMVIQVEGSEERSYCSCMTGGG